LTRQEIVADRAAAEVPAPTVDEGGGDHEHKECGLADLNLVINPAQDKKNSQQRNMFAEFQ
jgi:hypothetical protein